MKKKVTAKKVKKIREVENFAKEKTKILEKERLQREKGQKTEFSEDDKEYEGSDQEIECGDEESDQESSRRKKRFEKKDTRKKTVKMKRKIKGPRPSGS